MAGVSVGVSVSVSSEVRLACLFLSDFSIVSVKINNLNYTSDAHTHTCADGDIK